MNEDTYLIRPLNTQDRSGFNCGVKTLNDYLLRYAKQDMKKDLAACYVLEDKTHPNTAIGYYTLSSTGLDVTMLPEALLKRMPRYPLLPAVLLGRLAIDKKYQKRGIGDLLISDAFIKVNGLRAELGISAMVVDAIDKKAEGFYAKHGFTKIVSTQSKMLLRMADIKRIVLH